MEEGLKHPTVLQQVDGDAGDDETRTITKTGDVVYITMGNDGQWNVQDPEDQIVHIGPDRKPFAVTAITQFISENHFASYLHCDGVWYFYNDVERDYPFKLHSPVLPGLAHVCGYMLTSVANTEEEELRPPPSSSSSEDEAVPQLPSPSPSPPPTSRPSQRSQRRGPRARRQALAFNKRAR
jgi:hypothetical protein